MADDHKYVIVIKNESSDEDDSPIAGAKKKTPKTEKGSAKAKKMVKGLVAYNTYVKPFVSATVGHYISTVSLRTGSEELQQKLQFAYDTAGSVFNIGASILAGAAIGNIPGAVAGAVIGVTTTAISYANKASTIKMQSDLEGITIQGVNRRAGGSIASFSGSRGRNQ